MKKIFLLLLMMITICISSFAQGVGIGTNSPDSSAALDVSSTSKGYLYPRMTTAQRDAIVNPADGLQIFNTDAGMPEYYSNLYKSWLCMGSACTQKIFRITITGQKNDVVVIGHNSAYYGIDTTQSDNALIIVTITPGTILYAGIAFDNLNKRTTIVLTNYGEIYGRQGHGGNGEIQTQSAQCSSYPPRDGGQGGTALFVKYDMTIYNYGKIYGGGGGGAGGGKGLSYTQNGGGGGSGIGLSLPYNSSDPGSGGFTLQPFCTVLAGSSGASGTAGNVNLPGTGGAGINGGTKGGDGGGWGQPGANTNVAKGGKAGYAIYHPPLEGNVKIISLKGSSILGIVSN